MGLRNSSSNISPGCVGGRSFDKRRFTSWLVVIDNFDLVGISILPFETDPELLVYPEAVLTFSVTAKTFQTITRWDGKRADFSDTMDLVQLTLGNRPQGARAATSRRPGISAIKYVFGTLAVKRFYHGLYYNGIHYSCQSKCQLHRPVSQKPRRWKPAG
jgi:hypothetical protein